MGQAGIVVRGQDRHDRRRYALDLTDLGRARLPVALDSLIAVEREFEGILNQDGVRELRRLLTTLLP
ncbi:hypothetical protein [Micromonospora taraxaci]|uniref:hypothetical protein n=1 Tax=Micromonospora taraxaci TaxID=1316803 RepID=UPI0033A00019